MSNGTALEDLLRELRGAASPVQRVKLLGRAWRSLRRLDRRQLQELGRRAGFDQAEGFLERLARDKGRLTPSLLLQIVQRVRNVDEGDVDNLVRGLRDPEQREELLHGGIELVGDLLEEPPSEEEAVAASPPEKPEEDEPAPPPPEPEIEPPQPVPLAVPETAAAEPEQEIVPEPPPVEEPAPKPVAPVAVAAAPAVAPAFEAPPAPVVSVTQEPAVSTDAAPDAVIERLTSAPSTQRRLGIVRNELDRLGELDVDALQRLLELFPDGWARRRALATLLRAGIPDTLMHAVYLIEQLESPTARRWCVGALLDGRQLSPDERAALIERHGLFPHRRST